MKINSLTLQYVADYVKIPKDTLILCHRNPDPDTLGSAFALKCILEHFGSRVDVACADKPSKRLSFITDGLTLEYTGKEYERIICVDVASPSQLGELGILAEKTDLTIDHHQMNIRFSPYYEDICSACAEIIMLLARELNILDKLPLKFFVSVYAGISGDTGGFKYSNVTPRTHILASEILENAKELNHAEINRIIFESKTLSVIKGEQLTYENMELYCENKLAIILFTKEMKEKNGLTDEDISDIVNCIRAIEGVLVAVSIKQSSKEEDKFFISSRANAEIDVSRVCAIMGGGGHVRAAGATISATSPAEARARCVSLFEEAVKNYSQGEN